MSYISNISLKLNSFAVMIVIFQDTFGGNCLTSVFALLHPHGNDNAKALKVSQTIRNIKQNVSINMVSVPVND